MPQTDHGHNIKLIAPVFPDQPDFHDGLLTINYGLYTLR
jgi:hypothetical protein